MPSYDAAHFNPPAPVAEVSLRDSLGGPLVSNVWLLIDSGADVTLLPRRAVAQLGIAPVIGAHYVLQGFDGTSSPAEAVDLDMIFLDKAFRGRYLLIDADRGVLG